MAASPRERGDDIRRARKKQGYCGTCDEHPPSGHVTAEDLWTRLQARGRGFVRVDKP